ncbi:MAG TPA: DUF5011 domain-containing protein [Candidatus Hydrogenedentes bacterium]|nr:DUF5011 domain-containing protein [Candidatus Hydrogenedentota bacterium]
MRRVAGALVWMFALAACRGALAVPAFPDAVEVTQPDGSMAKVRLRGNEHFSWHETEQGYAVVKDPADGFWKYARPATDRAAFEAVPDGRVGASNPVALGVQKHALPDRTLVRQQVDRRRQDAGRTYPGGPPKTSSLPATSETPGSPPLGVPVSGTKTVKNVVILACFKDHWDSAAGTVLPAHGRVNVSEYTSLFNEIGYAADGAVGSVKDYYREVSYGKLTVDSAVSIWVRLPQNESYYGANQSGSDAKPQQMVLDAINAADAAGFDFSQGDSDGDGWVDDLTILHSGHGEEYGGNPSTCIWSHKWSLSSPVTKDSVQMFTYHTEPALRGLMSNTGITRIGVICHETGHFFGLPDLYDYSDATNGIGNWGLMASGSWNGSDGKRPAHLCAWSKCMLGFVSPEEIHSSGAVTLPRVEDSASVHLFRDGMSDGEYFLVENRANVGFDNDANIYPGLLIYHVDSKSSDNDLGTWAHPVVKIEEADGNNSLGAKTAGSQPGDVWTSASGLAGGFRDQTGAPGANAMLYQTSHPYNRSDVPAFYSYIQLAGFSAPGAVMSYTASTLKPTVSSFSTSSPNYTVTWGACTNAARYEIQEGAPVTLTTFSDSAESEDAMNQNWVLGGTVLRDSGSAKSGSFSYAMHQYYGGKWYSSVQALTLRNAFKVTPSTVVSYYLLSHLYTGSGSLVCQISNDDGNTWKTLASYAGYIDPWAQRTHTYSAISALGIAANDLCLIRFVANFEYPYGWSAYPGYGYALDDISITGTEIASFGNWATVHNGVVGTSYPLTGKPNGVYAYRVQAYANAIWQGYGLVGTVLVFAVDTVPPVITMLGSNPVTVNQNAVYTDAGATAIDDKDGDITANIVASSTVNTAVLGSYTVTYTVSDAAGNPATPVVRIVNVVEPPDTVPPVITILGSNPVTVNQNAVYVDAGATAIDNKDGDITANIVATSTVNTAVAGTYAVTYTVSDAAGNAAAPAVRTVKVVAPVDTTPPVIATLGSASITLQAGATYVDAGATASDNVDGDITSRIVTVNPVNTHVLGTYYVTYDVTDAAGNAAVQKKRTVKVVDTTKPVLTLLGSSTVTINVFSTYVDAGATATDNLDGDITANIVVTGSVNANVVGAYYLYYNISDSMGNAATQKTRIVKVVDKVKPVIAMRGATPVTAYKGATYVDAGATALDNYDGDITSDIVATSTVNTAVAGTYTVKYNVKDASNNAAATVTRTVKVVAAPAPTITLLGSSTVTINVFDTYIDAGATATDSIDGDITSKIVTTGLVNTSVVGTHYLAYNVTNSMGGTAAPKTRTVNVVDKIKPVIAMLGGSTVTINVFDTYTDAGATAWDNYDGNVTANIVATGSVNTNIIGTYYIAYAVKDSSNNMATAKRTIKVVDKVKPVITMLGATPVTLHVGQAYIDAGATALDNYDGDITDKIVATSTVNTAVVGTYTVKYSVKDASNNAATTLTRTVKVIL